MITGKFPVPNWRNEPNIVATDRYKKRFAFLPIKCSDGKKIWFKTYYTKYVLLGNCTIHKLQNTTDEIYVHTDFIENITEAEFLVRKLAESL